MMYSKKRMQRIKRSDNMFLTELLIFLIICSLYRIYYFLKFSDKHSSFRLYLARYIDKEAEKNS